MKNGEELLCNNVTNMFTEGPQERKTECKSRYSREGKIWEDTTVEGGTQKYRIEEVLPMIPDVLQESGGEFDPSYLYNR